VMEAIPRVDMQLQAARAEADAAAGKLAAEEIAGKVKPATVQAADQASIKAAKLEATLRSVVQVSGLAYQQAEADNNAAEQEYQSARQSVVNMNEWWPIAADDTKEWKRREDYVKKQTELIAECERRAHETKQILELLKKYRKAYGTTETDAADASMIETARKLWDQAVDTYRIRRDARDHMIQRQERTQAMIERLHKESAELSTAIQATRPESAGDYVHLSGIMPVLEPDTFRPMHDSQRKGKIMQRLSEQATVTDEK